MEYLKSLIFQRAKAPKKSINIELVTDVNEFIKKEIKHLPAGEIENHILENRHAKMDKFANEIITQLTT